MSVLHPLLSRASTGTNELTSGCCTGGSTSLCLRGPSVCSDLCMSSTCVLPAPVGYLLYCTGRRSFWFEGSELSRLLGVCLYACGDRSLLYCVFCRECHAVGAASRQLEGCLLICPCPSPTGPPELASPMLKVDQYK